jgi:hypothetical protein
VRTGVGLTTNCTQPHENWVEPSDFDFMDVQRGVLHETFLSIVGVWCADLALFLYSFLVFPAELLLIAIDNLE